MSKREGKAQQSGVPQNAIASAARKFLIVMVIALAFVGMWSLGRYHRAHRYDTFARCLTEKNARMYGLYWCPHCIDQKAMFDASFHFVQYEECGTPDHKESQRCIDSELINFPTWQFADGERHEGIMEMKDLASRSGCSQP